MNKQLARITSAELRMDRGDCLTLWLFVDYEDSVSQCVGGHLLCNPAPKGYKFGHRQGTAYGAEYIRRMFWTFDITKLEELKGRSIWVYGEGEGLSFAPKGVGSMKMDKRPEEPRIFMFSECFEEMKDK